MNVIPSKLKNKVLVRENVPQNVESLTRRDRKELWRALSKIVKTPLFLTHTRLDHYLPVTHDYGKVFYGSVIKDSFIAVVKVTEKCLHLLSVINIERLLSSTKEYCCTLVNDLYSNDDHEIHVFSGVDSEKNIIWRYEERFKSNNCRKELRGEMIITYSRRPSILARYA